MTKTEPVANVVERESWGGRFEFLLSCIGMSYKRPKCCMSHVYE